jgi:ribosome-binding factor A
VEKEIREVIATYLLSGFRGETHGFVSVSRVQASRDLHHAKVFITVMGSEEDRKLTLAELNAHAYEIQGEVNRHLRLKFVPRLQFEYDAGMENSMRVDKILRDLARERDEKSKAGEGSAEGGGQGPVYLEGPQDDADEDDQDER